MSVRIVPLLVAVALTMISAVSRAYASGRDCSPARNDAPTIEYHVDVEPGADVTLYPWLGERAGGWANHRGGETLMCGRLVVTGLKAGGSVAVTYSHGESSAASGWNLSAKTYTVTGTIAGKTLAFDIPLGWGSYRMIFTRASEAVEGAVTVYKHTSVVGTSTSTPDFLRVGEEIRPPVGQAGTQRKQ